jgi:Arc/MetJ-type ribon-helix-helix transcriptional regulator
MRTAHVWDTPWETACYTQAVPISTPRRRTTQIAIRLPDALLRRLDALVPESYPTRSEAIRQVLEAHLTRLASERDARIYEEMPLTDDELALADASWSMSAETLPPWEPAAPEKW